MSFQHYTPKAVLGVPEGWLKSDETARRDHQARERLEEFVRKYEVVEPNRESQYHYYH